MFLRFGLFVLIGSQEAPGEIVVIVVENFKRIGGRR